ncbi:MULTISPECIES: transketolase [Thermodesulfovibrio]|jgi:transketolase|uniref:transketolase n=1 Tax=Thermodesulfovibrio TaxID=28261 RepID=UPI00345B3DD8
MARKIRIEIVKMLAQAGSGHTGGSLSAADIISALYFYKMRHDPKNPSWEKRDRFVLSKGHAAPVLYAALALCGYFDISLLGSLRKLNSPLQGHPCCKSLPGIEVSTGSLGQGLSVANGMALGIRLSGIPARVYCLLGDGEIQEGQVWEAAMTASHYKIDNLCAIIDHNNLQIDGHCTEVMNIEPVDEKFKAFGWNVFTIDGHNMSEIVSALDDAEKIKEKPTMIVAKTIKGKGVSIFEGKAKYHGVAPTKEELEIALKELGDGKN